MGTQQPVNTVDIPYHRALSEKSSDSFMTRMRRAFKKAFSNGPESPTPRPEQPAHLESDNNGNLTCYRLPYAQRSLMAGRQDEEGDSMGSNSTDAPEDRTVATMVALHRTIPESGSRCSSHKPPVWTSSRPPPAPLRSQPCTISHNNNPSYAARSNTRAVFSDGSRNPFVDDDWCPRGLEGMPGKGALIPKGGGGEFRSARKPASLNAGDVVARMRMLGEKCKNDSGQHKLSRDPVSGKKLLVLR
ncbi:hypothetical protein Pmar_PMAR020583 [Perkinsus marinus ATCC 50983]|uniref:Uncharacterized protein n=1 Tax=Perkinsus marinus (strain ATCC 50983 / TXsc) TaxID=423536 RepID=C5L7F6_PERM5|nr:hypothetical protein Pmar_PMAR020583 [Perkinsus marinus ATCC 50983]EER07418.1 hypothetical protein Pmar_PMAR020583 [Perkinsus marinus ATCC 50983]|eukprot:XP_002775602.1 hypothetical protein Pmar_PMAR020583 [Perkinsus marinus ATCC 50983]